MKTTVKKLVRKIQEIRIGYIQKKEIKQLLSLRREKIKLSLDKKRQIQDYFLSVYRRKVSPLWHEYYYSINGLFDVRYIPMDLFFTKVKLALMDTDMARAYSDKNIYDNLFQNECRPKTIIKSMYGFLYNNDIQISKKQGIELCLNLKNVIYKPTLETGQGKNVVCFSSENGKTNWEDQTIEDIICNNKNYIIQERVKQQPLLASLNNSSLNTFRVLTYRRPSGKIVVTSCTLKIGKKGAIVDNGHASGYFCGVDIKEGRLRNYLFSLSQNVKTEITESGVNISKLNLPFLKNVLDAAIRMHQKIPYSNIVGWDIAVNDKDEAVLIELNLKWMGGNILQIPNGPMFGEYTEEVLTLTKNK